jgi:hypothetical protein
VGCQVLKNLTSFWITSLYTEKEAVAKYNMLGRPTKVLPIERGDIMALLVNLLGGLTPWQTTEIVCHGVRSRRDNSLTLPSCQLSHIVAKQFLKCDTCRVNQLKEKGMGLSGWERF